MVPLPIKYLIQLNIFIWITYLIGNGAFAN